jgi:hypothetical protein
MRSSLSWVWWNIPSLWNDGGWQGKLCKKLLLVSKIGATESYLHLHWFHPDSESNREGENPHVFNNQIIQRICLWTIKSMQGMSSIVCKIIQEIVFSSKMIQEVLRWSKTSQKVSVPIQFHCNLLPKHWVLRFRNWTPG